MIDSLALILDWLQGSVNVITSGNYWKTIALCLDILAMY